TRLHVARHPPTQHQHGRFLTDRPTGEETGICVAFQKLRFRRTRRYSVETVRCRRWGRKQQRCGHPVSWLAFQIAILQQYCVFVGPATLADCCSPGDEVFAWSEGSENDGFLSTPRFNSLTQSIALRGAVQLPESQGNTDSRNAQKQDQRQNATPAPVLLAARCRFPTCTVVAGFRWHDFRGTARLRLNNFRHKHAGRVGKLAMGEDNPVQRTTNKPRRTVPPEQAEYRPDFVCSHSCSTGDQHAHLCIACIPRN